MDKNPLKVFEQEVKEQIQAMGEDKVFSELTNKWMNHSAKHKYSYNYRWLGRPIIQHPEDMVAMQELIWDIKPDLIMEAGIAHGGSLIFYASILELIGGNGRVLGLDIDIREHNRIEIEKHTMNKRITMIEGDSTSQEIAQQVYDFAKGKEKIIVILDSNHTHEHVLAELNLYAQLVTKDSYLVVFDTIVEDIDESGNRPWGKGNNPKTAVHDFLKSSDKFVIDKELENKLQITVCPDGYLKRIKD